MIDGCKEYFRRARKNGWNVYPYVEKETLNCNLEQNFQPINLELVTYIYVYIHIAICVYINDIQLLYKHIRNIIYIAVFYVISTLQTDTGLRVFTCDHRLSRRESALKFRDCVSERDIIYIYIYIKRKKKVYIQIERKRKIPKEGEKKREKYTIYLSSRRLHIFAIHSFREHTKNCLLLGDSATPQPDYKILRVSV